MISLQTKWPTRKLADCGDWVSGGTPSKAVASFWNGNIPWISSKSLKSFDLCDSKDRITQAAVDNGTSLVPTGTVMFVVRGMSLANEFRVGVTTRPVAFNQDLRAIVPADDIDGRYLTHFLKANQQVIIGLANNASHGTKRLPTEMIEAVDIPVPPLPEQRHIAAILDKAGAIRHKRAEGIRLTEELLRSTFLEMFGDPATNPNGWNRRPLASVETSDGIKCGPFGTQLSKSEFQSDGIPLWGIKHVNSHFRTATDEFLSASKAEALDAYSLLPGDIVMTRKGTIGNCSVYPTSFSKGIMHSDLLRLRVDRAKILPEFLSYQLSISPDVQFQLESISTGAIMAGVNVTKLKCLCVLVPPIQVQGRFVMAAQRIGEQRNLRTRCVAEANDLFASLVQRAFRGELLTGERM